MKNREEKDAYGAAPHRVKSLIEVIRLYFALIPNVGDEIVSVEEQATSVMEKNLRMSMSKIQRERERGTKDVMFLYSNSYKIQ